MSNYDSVENGESIIETAIKNFGRIDILINNAGILRDVSFRNMRDEDWDLVMKVHVRGAYKVCRASKAGSRVFNTHVWCSVPELRGHTGESRNMADLLARHQQQDFLGASGNVTTRVSFVEIFDMMQS